MNFSPEHIQILGVVVLVVAAVFVFGPMALSWVRDQVARFVPQEYRPEWDVPMGEEDDEYDDEAFYTEWEADESRRLVDRLEWWASLHEHCLTVGDTEAAEMMVKVLPAIACKELPEE
jgi:hypothetical protein